MVELESNGSGEAWQVGVEMPGKNPISFCSKDKISVTIADPDRRNTNTDVSAKDHHEVHLVHVFVDGPGGGNPAPIVADAAGMTSQRMHDVAREYGYESGFILPPPTGTDYDFSLRFWMPNHEVSMCGHATVGAIWLLGQLGRLVKSELKIETPSGPVFGRISDGRVEISQPAGRLEAVKPEAITEILGALGITEDQLADRPIINATTSRAKTLVPLRDPSVLDGLSPDYSRIERACELADSTGLYPWAPSNPEQLVFDARQFPRSSGYPEDAATGIAAAALIYGLLADGLVASTETRAICIRQGRAMGKPSKIELRLNPTGGLWLGGNVR